MKTCKMCNEEKPLDNYYIAYRYKEKDYFGSYCIECDKERSKKYSDDHIEERRERQRAWRERNRDKENQRNREYRLNNAKKVKLARSKYNKENVDALREYQRASKMNDPEKFKARELLNGAVRSKKIIKPDHCSLCGKGGKVDGHHEDYSRPLDVIWLCRACHMGIHNEAWMSEKLSAQSN